MTTAAATCPNWPLPWGPYRAALFQLELREFPRELSSAPAEYLRRHFAHPRPGPGGAGPMVVIACVDWGPGEELELYSRVTNWVEATVC